MSKRRIEINRDYLIIAPQPETGNYQMLTERAYLADNLLNFIEQHSDIEPHQITIYELVEINE